MPRWRLPQKRKGEALQSVTVDFEPAFARALRAYAKQARAPYKSRKKVSQGTILFTLAMLSSPELRALYEQEKAAEAPSATQPSSAGAASTDRPSTA